MLHILLLSFLLFSELLMAADSRKRPSSDTPPVNKKKVAVQTGKPARRKLHFDKITPETLIALDRSLLQPRELFPSKSNNEENKNN
jgi:hypothetical protein